MVLCIHDDGNCSMESPLQFTGLTPVKTVRYLADRGLNIIAPNTIDGISPKTPDLEDVLAQGIADIAIGFVVAWSKWNAVLPADRAMLVMREKLNYDAPEPEDGAEDEEEETGEAEKKPKRNTLMKAILVKANHIVQVPNTEDEEECSVKPKEGSQIHQHILPMFLDGASPEVKTRVRNSSSFMCDSTLYFMRLLRLFSMTK
jgi:hypothetical protein